MNKNKILIKKIKNFYKKNIKPILNIHQGDLKIIDINKKNFLLIKFTGKCKLCNINNFTFENIIKKKIIKNFPEIKNIINII